MRLSIITINYNNKDGLEKTVESVLYQSSYGEFEYIVVDGASVDGSSIVLKKHGARCSCVISEPDSGIYDAMNKGVRASSGDYLLFLNSGDTLYSEHTISDILPKLIADDLIIGRIMKVPGNVLSDSGMKLSLFHFIDKSLPHQATFIRRNLLMETPYDEKYRIVSDWKFFVQAVVIGNCSYKYIDDIVSYYDCNGLSSNNRDESFVERDMVLHELFPERILKDYRLFMSGRGYEDTVYDKFFIKLRNYKYGRVLYSLNVLILKIASLFMPGARFVRFFPFRLPN